MTRMHERRTHVAGASAALAVGLVVSLSGPAPLASAVPPHAPSGLAVLQPDGTTSLLSWSRVSGGAKYDVQVDDDSGFISPEYRVTTANTTAVPDVSLKGGTNHWRVRAIAGNGEASAWSDAAIVNAPAVGVPQAISPAQDDALAQPDEPPLLGWSTVQGATSYRVEVDGDSDFIGATPYVTKTTSFVVPNPLNSGDWYWRVTAIRGDGLESQPSPPSRFVISPLAGGLGPDLVSPANDPVTPIEDVVLDWTPVPGAKHYELLVATDIGFNTLVEGTQLSPKVTLGTRYSPPITYDNNQYYWKVRAVDLANEATDWSEVYTFNRDWREAPTPVYPSAGEFEAVGAPLYFQWTPVDHASEYELQVGTDENFSPGTFNSCVVAGTTYTPHLFAIDAVSGQKIVRHPHEKCVPNDGVPSYWRVRPLDRPFLKSGAIAGVQGEFSATKSFVYRPQSLSGFSPTAGATVDVPTLRWTDNVGFESYAITIKNNAGQVVDTATTRSTSYTPDGFTPLDPAKDPYTWSVQGIRATGSPSMVFNHTFSVSGNVPPSTEPALTPLTGTSSDAATSRAPALTWAALEGAHHYRVSIGPAGGDNLWFIHQTGDLLEQDLPYPAMTDTSARFLQPGSYDWRVSAYDASNVQIATGPEATFTISPIGVAAGRAIALNGGELDGTTGDTPCVDQLCTAVPSTPVLRWQRVPDAAFYMVYVSEDGLFTNLLEPTTQIPATSNTMYAPTFSNRHPAYADSQAGQAYFWFVRPCRGVGKCGPDPVSTSGVDAHRFTKTSPAVRGLTASTDGDEVTFTWEDYRATNHDTTWSTDEQGNQSAMRYRIQVDTDTFFQSPLVDDRYVDQTTYTAFDRLYQDGTLYFRVQAIDGTWNNGTGNALTWSEPQPLVKKGTAIHQLSPVGGDSVPGTTSPLRWGAQSFASAYEVEVYRDDTDPTTTVFSPGNRVFNTTVKTAAYAWHTPLPVSELPYVWRVRRIDSDGNPGPWSAGASFKVVAGGLDLTSPAADSIQAPNGPLLTWQPVDGASKYRVEVVSGTTGQTVEFTTTVATAYAVTRNLTSGSHTWKVTALDPGGNTMVSASRGFVVDAAVVAVSAPIIAAPGGSGVGQTLSSTPPTWDKPGVTNTYQWLRDGSPISGATGATYTLTIADYGKIITLKITGKLPGYADGTATSNGIGGSAGGALQASQPPTVTGTAVVGSNLSANPGTWSETGASFKYQWLRTGAPIPRATGRLYLLTHEDAGKEISVTVLASKTGFNDGSAAAAAVSVPKLASKTAATLSATRVKVGKRVKIGITVAVAGVPGPTGSIKVFDGAKRLKTLTLVSTRDGKIAWRLPKLKKGKHKIKAVYFGNASIAASKSQRVKLYVVR